MRTTSILSAGAVAAGGLLTLAFWLKGLEVERASWSGPALDMDAGRAPLLLFERQNVHDPGVFRLLAPLAEPPKPGDWPPLARSVELVGEAAAGRLTPFVNVWEKIPVVEVRVPLTQGAQGDDGVLGLHVPAVGRTFTLARSKASVASVRVRKIAVLGDGRLMLDLASTTAEPLTLDGISIDGFAIGIEDPIVLPANAACRLWLDVVGKLGSEVAVVLSRSGEWLQAYEVALVDGFRISDWDQPGPEPLGFSEAGPLERHGGTVRALDADVCEIEWASGVPTGSYLHQVRRALYSAQYPNAWAATLKPGGDGTADMVPETFLFLSQGNRPLSHYVYGRLSDYVGVGALDIQWFGASFEDVLFWLRMDRRIIEPRRLVAIPGAFEWKDAGASHLTPLDLQRLVLTSLAIAPDAIVYYRGTDDERVYGFLGRDGLRDAVASINHRIQEVAEWLGGAAEVRWVYRKHEGRVVYDAHGATGFFTLWSGYDHLLVLSLGGDGEGLLRLPEGITLRGLVSGPDVVGPPNGEGRRLWNDGREEPTVSTYRLAVDHARSGAIAWFAY